MWHHKTSLPTPLKDVQIALQADESRRYDPHSYLPSPAYPFERQAVLPLQENHSACQLLDSLPLGEVEPSVLLTPRNTINYRWNDSLDPQDDNPLGPVLLHSPGPCRSFTPPISPPVLSPPPTDTEYSSKRSGMTFALVPAEVDGKHVLTHVVVNRRGNDYNGDSDPLSIPPGEDGLPEDMQDILRQLDDLASWVKAASSSTDCVANIRSIVHATRLTGLPGTDAGGDGTGRPSDGLFINKGKSRLLSTSPPNSECGTRRDLVESSRGAMPRNPANIFPGINCQSEGFIYVPDCNTPEFLAGSSNSPIAYPVYGYSSHPSRYSPHPPGPTHDIHHHRRFLERRSAPCPPPTSPLVSPPSGKTSFKTLFQRSRCNTTAVSCPTIPPSHVPVEHALRQGKRMRLPWLRI